jgi:hypothetical protein
VPVQVTLANIAPVATFADGNARSMPRARMGAFMIALAIDEPPAIVGKNLAA